MYKGVLNIFSRYWKTYGGTSALLRSAYFHAAIILLLLTAHYWLTEKWWEQSISILPNLLGFSLGGFAMFLGFGDEKFRAILAEKSQAEATSAYLNLSASFVHFIFIQFLALIAAILAKSLDFYITLPDCISTPIWWLGKFFHGIGYLLFLYSITSMLAATMAVFRTCSWYEILQNKRNNNGDSDI
jgi:prepilin signal peptidase PulO-like enzyme (type II secretory pathway)